MKDQLGFDAPPSKRIEESLAWAAASGFLDAFGVEHIGQVRVNDNRGTHEEHLVPGEGNIDFRAVLTRLREMGYAGPFCFGFGDEAAKLRVRDTFLAS
ncbi:MAG: hypothetical protein EXS64_07170 [Candidatus Latescibacteria bacterium]|nr:hypothetical protein [Candidatus Latescibacterota bacterium]